MGIGTPRSQSNMAGMFELRVLCSDIEKFGNAPDHFKSRNLPWRACHGRVMGAGKQGGSGRGAVRRLASTIEATRTVLGRHSSLVGKSGMTKRLLQPPQSNEAAMLTESARITVLNRKPITPCSVARRRSFFEVMLQSETWKVMPSTNEK